MRTRALKKNIHRLLILGLGCMLCMLCLETSVLAAEPLGGTEDLMRLTKNMDIWFMLFLVAILMVFIRKFEWTVCLAVGLTAASSILLYLAAYQWIWKTPPEELWSQTTMIGGVSCAITAVIAIGCFLGTIKPWQFIFVSVLFVPAYIFLEYALFIWLPAVAGGEVIDPGGAILVHMFAAYWGLGTAIGIAERRAFDEPMFTSKHSITLGWMASFLLFMLWPSFVTGLLPIESTTPVMINCYMSGFGSILSAFVTCTLLSKNRKVNPLIYMYALLAGPVASSSALLLATPWACVLIGVIAGIACTLAFTYLQGWLCNKLNVLDVMGVHNLHGIGAWISLLSAAILAKSIVNIWAAILTVVLGLITGIISGKLLRLTRGDMRILFEDDSVFEDYNPDPMIEPSCKESV